eukprot:scaffold2501_cov113-Isochrysis_galbana.AAC.10
MSQGGCLGSTTDLRVWCRDCTDVPRRQSRSEPCAVKRWSHDPLHAWAILIGARMPPNRSRASAAERADGCGTPTLRQRGARREGSCPSLVDLRGWQSRTPQTRSAASRAPFSVRMGAPSAAKMGHVSAAARPPSWGVGLRPALDSEKHGVKHVPVGGQRGHTHRQDGQHGRHAAGEVAGDGVGDLPGRQGEVDRPREEDARGVAHFASETQRAPG